MANNMWLVCTKGYLTSLMTLHSTVCMIHWDFTKHMGSQIENEETKERITKKKTDLGCNMHKGRRQHQESWKIKSENWVNLMLTFPTINKGKCIVVRKISFGSHQILNGRKKPSRTKISPFSSMNIWTSEQCVCIGVQPARALYPVTDVHVCMCESGWMGASMCKHILLLLLYSRRLIDVFWIAVQSTFRR